MCPIWLMTQTKVFLKIPASIQFCTETCPNLSLPPQSHIGDDITCTSSTSQIQKIF